MKAIRNLIAATAIAGASFTAGTALDNPSVPGSPNACAYPWEGQRSEAPAELVVSDLVEHFPSEPMLVCRLTVDVITPAGTYKAGAEVSFFDTGRVFGYDSNGVPMAGAAARDFYEAAR